MSARPLLGKRVATTRDEPGHLDAVLAERGATVVHVPLIEIVDTDRTELAEALATGDHDWVVVTSHHGAARVGRSIGAARTAAVGTRTAEVLSALSGRSVDVVPGRQTAADLVTSMPEPAPGSDRVLVAQADRAEPTLVDGLRDRGYRVRSVVAYRTRLRRPDEDELAALAQVDAVAFASGSAVRAWAETVGRRTPPHVVVIGPTTERVARDLGVRVTAVAGTHDVVGLADAVTEALTEHP